jgi:VanZ family protein
MGIIKYFEKHYLISWIITILIASIIFYLSSQTFHGTSTTSWLSIVYHFFAFFFLGAFLLISLIKGKINRPLFIIGIALAVLYGFFDEIHQYFVPGRHFSLLDILTDSTGVLTASTIYLALRSKK